MYFPFYIQERESGYNAFEKDVAVVNIFFGQPTTFGNYSIISLKLHCPLLRVRKISQDDLN